MKKRFLGFGFGAIQTGLFLYEAMRSGNFESFTIVEIEQDLVDRVRANGNSVKINIAGRRGIERVELSNIRIFNPRIPSDQEIIAKAISEADEMTTAVPSVRIYGEGDEASIASLLAGSINSEKPQILYAAENNNYAGEILRSEILKFASEERLQHFQILDTVIGKMSGTVEGREQIDHQDLAPLTPEMTRAVLVEEFNRILISQIYLPDFKRGIDVFKERSELLPYEEVKLYGHNAVHAMLGYMAYLKGYQVMSQIGDDDVLLDMGREALVMESGAALIRKYGSLADPLFTSEGFQQYADDLLARIVNPHLHDRVRRICRDPLRKLGYSDRLFGSIREALKNGITPLLLAQGALAALEFIMLERIVPNGISFDRMDPASAGANPAAVDLDEAAIRALLEKIWKNDPGDEYREDCIRLVVQAAAKAKGGYS